MKTDASSIRRIIVALDDVSKERINRVIEATAPFIGIYKIGSIAFTAFGPKLIEDIKNRDKEVFLDLKYYDIPNTVSKAVEQAASYGVRMMTLHTLGGYEMLQAAAAANRGRSILLGVTVLTSFDNAGLRKIGIEHDTGEMVTRLAMLAHDAGIDGLVASGHEVAHLRQVTGDKTIIVVPGIRFEQGASSDDQKRVMSPQGAFDAGADYLVIGRPVTESGDPAKVLIGINNSLLH